MLDSEPAQMQCFWK